LLSRSGDVGLVLPIVDPDSGVGDSCDDSCDCDFCGDCDADVTVGVGVVSGTTIGSCPLPVIAATLFPPTLTVTFRNSPQAISDAVTL